MCRREWRRVFKKEENNLNAYVQVHGTTRETDFTTAKEEWVNQCLHGPAMYYMSLASDALRIPNSKRKKIIALFVPKMQ